MIPRHLLPLCIVSLSVLHVTAVHAKDRVEARWWLTTSDLEQRLQEQPAIPSEVLSERPDSGPLVTVDPDRRFQTVTGLGSSLEHSTCWNLSRLSPELRQQTMERLFDPHKGIGINLARICIGTPDFTSDAWYTYDDMPPGQTDPELQHFSIQQDRRYILPVLKQARKINPQLRFFASPWSPPGWMTTTDNMIGGSLRPEYFAAYAQYFVRFIEAYRDEGITVHAVTVQNEPGVDRSLDEPEWHYPSCRYSAEQERDFIRNHLGPALQRAGLPTEIWTYDHNFNVKPTADGDDPGIAYPRTVLSDPEAAKYVSGVAFHGYAGSPDGMSAFAAEFPDIPVHFTEGSVFGPRGGRRLIDYLNHQASSYNGWVTLLDTHGKPNNGPFEASRTCVTTTPDYSQVSYHFDYYQYGHFFRFLKRGAVRVHSSVSDDSLGVVAMRHPDSSITVVLVNADQQPHSPVLHCDDHQLTMKLPAQSVATVIWKIP